MLSSVRDLLDQRLKDILRTEILEDRKVKIAELKREIREKLDTVKDSIRFANVITESALSEKEYVIPEVLVGLHKETVARFKRGQSIEKWPDKGMLLYGPPGTGKTEYIRFLMGEIGDRALVLKVNIPGLVNSPSPGAAIRDLYQQAQAYAEAQEKYVVLFFDEFEHLVRSFVRKAASIKRQDDAYGESSARHTHEEKKEFTVDKKGEEALSELKTVLSGTGTLQKVFTVCTSNDGDINDALIRDGRLKAVNIVSPTLKFELRDRGYSLWQRDFAVIKHMQLAMQYIRVTLFRLEAVDSQLMSLVKEIEDLSVIVQRDANERCQEIYAQLLRKHVIATIDPSKKNQRVGGYLYLEPLKHKNKEVTLEQITQESFSVDDFEKMLGERVRTDLKNMALRALHDEDMNKTLNALSCPIPPDSFISDKEEMSIVPAHIAAKVKEYVNDKDGPRKLGRVLFDYFFRTFKKR